ncbi:MAG: DUF4129 domain-containing protein [Candidatus Baltobacteraceae bacterium]
MNARGLPAFGTGAPPLDPRHLAVRILADPRFRVQIHRSAGPWWTRLLGWVEARLNALIGHNVHAGGPWLNAIGDIAVLAAAGLVIFATVRLLLNVAKEPEQTVHTVHPLAARTSARAWHDRALSAAAQGRYGVAAVLLFRAALAILDLRGVVRDEPSRTVNESKSELRRRAPQYEPAFDAVARNFTAALYAGAPVTRAHWEQAQNAYEQLFAAVTGGE